MHFTTAAFVFVSVVSVSVCAGKTGGRPAYLEHTGMLKMYPCEAPKARVFELENVLDKDMLKDFYNRQISVKPFVTVLQRCESTGCCENADERCSPVEAENVTLTFAAVGRTMIKYFDITQTNHIKCGCVKVGENSIK